MKFRLALPLALLVPLSVGARAEIFYTVQESTDTLYTIDTATLQFTPIGPLGVPTSFGDLAFDTSTGTMYLVDGWAQGSGVPSNLYRVNLNTGAATLVGSTGASSLFGLVYDPLTNKLYASTSTATSAFYEINRTTGAATYIGDPTVWLDGLTFVGSTNSIVGIYAGPGSVHTVDPTTGVATQVSAGGGFVDNCGVAWGPATNKVYSIDWSGELFSFDVANSYTRQTLTTGFGSFDGLAFAGSFCAPPFSYCTPGTTTHGCVPTIGSSGTPSLASSSGFTLQVANVEGQKSGIFFYAISGQLIQPWAAGSSSFLCVKPPTQRMTTQSTGGSINQCNGALSIDWRAFMTANPAALGQPLAVGEQFDAQAWFRDPPAPKTTNLTDALQWLVCP